MVKRKSMTLQLGVIALGIIFGMSVGQAVKQNVPVIHTAHAMEIQAVHTAPAAITKSGEDNVLNGISLAVVDDM